MAINLSKMLILCSTVSLLAVGSKSYAQAVGFEKEYATVGYMEKEWGHRQIETSRSLLQVIQSKFKGFGQIESRLWEKYSEKPVYHLFYRDPNGGIWSVDPEAVNTGGLDGLELVTPPLNSDEDLQKAKEILQDIKKEKIVMRGIRSSGHVTVDVSHLLKDPQDVSDLVDLILTIENHWPEIYKYFNPKRYGTIINRFSVPLAVDQQNLLKELAEMPKSLRTYNNVRNVFLKYDLLENKLRNEDGQNVGRKWKYRAANYGKLFQLNGNKPLGVIEFRIPDLDFGSKLIEQAQFIRRLVNVENKDNFFKARFGWQKLSWKEASEVIKRIPEDTGFVAKLGIEIKNTPVLKEETIELWDISQPVEKDSEYLTYGFEAEFRGLNILNVLTEDGRVRSDKFPFLDHNVSHENTGNTEIKSIGGEVHMYEVLEQMATVKSALKSDLRGFHFRVRIPKTMADSVGHKVLEAFANSIGDYVFAWRLQNRRSFFSLKSTTVGRNSIQTVNNRGTVRLIKLNDGKYDLEIRGFMTDISMIGKTAQIFVTGLMYPEKINTTYKEREARSKKILSLEDFISLHFSVSSEAKEVLRKLENAIRSEGLLPLYRFEDTIGLEEYERVRIRNANLEFAKETMSVVRNVLSNKYNGSFEEADKQFRWRIKRWVELLDLLSILEKHLLEKGTPESVKQRESLGQRNLERRSGLTFKNIEKAMQDQDANMRGGAVNALRNQTGDKALALIEKAMQDQDANVRFWAVDVLQNRTGDKALALIDKAMQDQDVNVRVRAAVALRNQTGDKALALIEKAMQDQDVNVRAKAAVTLRNQTGDKALALIEKAMQDQDANVRAWAVDALQNRTGDKALALIDKAMQDQDVNVRAKAAVTLGNQTGDKALVLIEKAMQDQAANVRSWAVDALQNRTGDKALALIEKAMQDQAANVRITAAVTLKNQTGDKALALIEKAMQDQDANVRSCAVDALQNRTGDKTLALIEKAMQDQDADVRVRAAAALRDQTGDKALALIEKAMQDQDVNVRSKAAGARNDSLTKAKRNVLNSHGSLDTRYQIDFINRCERVFKN